MCDMTHSRVRRDSFVCVTWLLSQYYLGWHTKKSFCHNIIHNTTHKMRACWPTHKCDMTHSYMSHDWFICVTWMIHMCDMTYSSMWHDSFTCVTWLIHVCDMTHSHVWHDSFTCVTWLIHVCVVTHFYACHDFFHSTIYGATQRIPVSLSHVSDYGVFCRWVMAVCCSVIQSVVAVCCSA